MSHAPAEKPEVRAVPEGLPDLQALRQEMDIYLRVYPSLVGSDICRLLDTPPLIDEDNLVRVVADTQEHFIGEIARATKNGFITEIQSSFPDKYADGLLTPKQYIKANSLDSSYRPRLRQAQTEVFAQSRARLIAAGKEDEDELLLAAATPEDTLAGSIHAHTKTVVGDVAIKIFEAAEAIKRLMPTERVYTGSPAAQYLALQGLAGNLMPKFPDTDEDVDALVEAFKDLKRFLQDYHKCPREIVRHVFKLHAKEVTSCVAATLDTHYNDLLAAELAVLADDLTEAYDSAASGAGYIRQTREQQKPREATPQAIGSIVVPEKVDHTPELTTLGIVEDVFPWAEDKEIEFKIETNGEHTIVYCSALSSAAKTISKGVRSTHGSAGSLFDRMWSQVRAFELTNPLGKHKDGGKVNHITAEYLRDLTILKYRGSDKRRLYYAKTKCIRYPQIAEAAEANGLSPDTTLLILIEETDKANQLRTYRNFGIRRANARSLNIGTNC